MRSTKPRNTDKHRKANPAGKRRELAQVAPNAWQHVRADGQVVTITVPAR
jgi:hypothetical protein